MRRRKYRLDVNAISGTIAEDLFQYGFACGVTGPLHLDRIREFFESHCLSEQEQCRYRKNIYDGYASGIEYSRKIRLN